MPAVQFVLNGDLRAEDRVPPTMTALDWLRTVARLTGTKEGCAEGDCGACTIAVKRSREGGQRYEAMNSCLMLLPQLDGCEVLTIEGIAGRDGALHPVQQALVDADATQCGFCTPGFAMAMFAFREGGEPADDATIHEALAGNLCRCTGYRAIVEACRRGAADEPRAAASPSPSWGGSACETRRGGEPSEELGDRHYPHPRPLPTRGRGAAPPCPPDQDASRTAGVVVQAFTYAFGPQTFQAPRTLTELVDLRAGNPEALLLAGGTDLGLRVSKEREAFACVISTAGVPELRHIEETADALEIGGAVTYTEALPFLDRHYPAFGALVRRIGSRQIRNLGTLAGNLATASPIGDTLPCLIALGAFVTLASRAGIRSLSVEDFITGYRATMLRADEVIAAIRIPFLKGEGFHAYKLSKRFDQDISTVVAAFTLSLEGGRVKAFRAVFGGMAARATRASHLETALTGRVWTDAALADVDVLIARDFLPLSDLRGSAGYRLRAAAGLVRRLQIETTSASPVRLEAL